ncbi:MAG: FtsK/SpoIIIE domain-containing protein, partial [Planctomycetota bacterium]|nr:FtsK/SpoIIIE domain-containing protein [Planctomycetota bacterium]
MADAESQPDRDDPGDPPEALAEGVDRIARAAGERERSNRMTVDQREADLAEETDRHLKNGNRIRQSAEGRMAELEAEHQRRLREEEARATAASRSFEDSTLRGRREIVDHGKKTTRNLKARMEEACWLAEAVFEANENKPRLDFEEFREGVETRKMELEELLRLSRTEVIRYRQRPSTIDRVPEEELAACEADPTTALADASRQGVATLSALKGLRFARIYRGALPILLLVVVSGAGAGSSFLTTPGAAPTGAQITSAGAIGFGIGFLVLAVGWLFARTQVKACWKPLESMQARLDLLHERLVDQARETRAQQERTNLMTRDHEIERANTKYPPLIEQARRESRNQLEALEQGVPGQRSELERETAGNLAGIESWWTGERSRQEADHLAETEAEDRRHADRVREIEETDRATQVALARTWREAVDRSAEVFGTITRASERLHPGFMEPAWDDWSPSTELPGLLRFGSLTLDRSLITGGAPPEERFAVALPERLELPAVLGYPNHASLFIDCDAEAHAAGTGMVRALMLRLIATMPPGKMQLTIIDPVGLGEAFAGFMHLADHDEKLISDRIWTETRHIEQRLLDITEHMEVVIQKYLRNEFESIIDYNRAAGEIAEPLRFLVVNDFPANFTEAAARRLASIATSGPRCGVHVILLHDTRRELPEAVDVATLTANAVHVRGRGGDWAVEDPRLEHLVLAPDASPPEELITRVANRVGEAAVLADRVEVPFSMIAPTPEQYWSASSTRQLEISLGRSGATKLQQLCLGVGTAQHALIAGKTGSGKSTLLHALVTNLACWYGPDEVEFWLVDFKKGVEFKVYANHQLPHARAVAVESDREFGVSVLQGLDEELKRRGDLYRDAGVQDLAGYRAERPGDPMPRVLLIIDEFQELFVEDDKLSQDASMLLDRLVRQGRAFGMHVVLGSQTLAGAYSLARSTMGQMGVRIALQCSETDSQVILSDDNSAARLLTRPGEAIYNDQSGLIEGNSPFQVCWLDDQTREDCLVRVAERAAAADRPSRTIVFEGSKPADLEDNRLLQGAIEAPPADGVIAPVAWLGEAVAIKDPTGARFRRQTAANLMVIGQQAESAIALGMASLLSIAAQYPPDGVAFTILDGTPADDPHHGRLRALADALPHACHQPGYHETDEAILALGRELGERLESGATDAPARILLIHGLQRYRNLRRTATDFGFGMDEDTPPTPDKVLATLIREGPIHGVHVIT